MTDSPGQASNEPPRHRAGLRARVAGVLRGRRRIRFVQQLESADCGAACLAMVLDLHGRETAPRDLLEAARTVVLSVALQALALSLPVLIGVLVDRVVPQQDRSLLVALALGFTAVVGFQMLVLLLRSYLLNYLKAALDAQLSLGFVDHLADLPLRFFVARRSGDLLARFESNRNLRQTLTRSSSRGIGGIWGKRLGV